jgi:2'-5' RNA ligase
LRAFVAIEIPDEVVLDSLVSFQKELMATGADLKLVEKRNLHFTVKFLGGISETQALDADRRLRSLQLAGSVVSVAGVGAFPTVHRPNVVWVGVGQDDESKVHSIAEGVIKALEGIGESDNRPFQAHLTLARVRSAVNRGELAALIGASSEKAFGSIKLTTFRLKSSQLTPRGPIYRDVGVYNLL